MNHRLELLSPAGNQEALKAAVENGADAVYLGGKRFGARAFSDNFDENALIEAFHYAHSHGVRVYVTLNTLIFPEEIPDALDYARFLSRHGVDGILIQDLGLVELLRRMFPDLPLHASTQMHIHNRDGLRLAHKLGLTRAVLARECSIEQISGYADEPIEKEIFVNGALCVSCSGQCWLSLDNGGRSGNRGACAQPCRLPYHLLQDGQPVKTPGAYLLSPKDLYTIHHIDELKASGVDSLKIEGRMKRPEYVALVTSQYRQALDAADHHSSFTADEESLKKLFNRGLTDGHLFNQRGLGLMNPLRPNHLGVPLGTVLHSYRGWVSIRLVTTLHQGDGIRFLTGSDPGFTVQQIRVNGQKVNQAAAGMEVLLPCDEIIPPKTQAVLTTDAPLLKQLEKTYESNIRHDPVHLTVHAHIGSPLSFDLQYLNQQFSVSDTGALAAASRHVLSTEDWYKLLDRTQDTPYRFAPVEFDIDPDVFVPASRINQLRRTALSQLEEKLCSRKPFTENPYTADLLNRPEPVPTVFVQVETSEQLETARLFPVEIYSSQPDLIQAGAHPVLPRYSEDTDVFITDQPVWIEETGQIDLPVTKRLSGIYMNAANAYAVRLLEQYGIQTVAVSRELSDNQIQSLVQQYHDQFHTEPDLAYFIYGRRDLMLSRYCAPNTYCSPRPAAQCGLCRKHHYALQSRNKTYPLGFDQHCFMHIQESRPFNRLNDISALRRIGIQSFIIRFTDENSSEAEKVLSHLK